MNIEMLDTLKQDFLKHYPKCKQFIDAGRIQGNVLVHWYINIVYTLPIKE